MDIITPYLAKPGSPLLRSKCDIAPSSCRALTDIRPSIECNFGNGPLTTLVVTGRLQLAWSGASSRWKSLGSAHWPPYAQFALITERGRTLASSEPGRRDISSLRILVVRRASLTPVWTASPFTMATSFSCHRPGSTPVKFSLTWTRMHPSVTRLDGCKRQIGMTIKVHIKSTWQRRTLERNRPTCGATLIRIL